MAVEATTEDASALPAPSRVARYQVGRLLGRGGNGVVYHATDDTGRAVALKLLLPELAADEQRRRRLLREARTIATVEHPNIARLYEVGDDGGSIYVAMELVDGVTLRERMKQPVAPAEAVKITRQIAGAVAAAHAQHVIHRDLKPENVMLSGDAVKVLDFGLAKIVDRPDSEATVSQLTEEGRVVGTHGYMSPEQIAGKPLDPRSDVWALGVILYELIAGKRPFTGETSVEVMIAVHRDVPAAIAVSPALQAIVMRCLAKRPEDRYANGAELCEALDGVDARRPNRKRIVLALAVVGALGAAGGAYALTRDASTPVVVEPCAEFSDRARWASYRPASHGGYVFSGGEFDGRYLYLAPAGPRGATRYDTKLPFDSAEAWTRSEVVKGPLSLHTRIGASIYYAGGKSMVRYDSSKPFDAAAAWERFDLGSLIPDLETTQFAGFDGRYLYHAPIKGGRVARYDTTRKYTDPASWETFALDALRPGGVCTDCAIGAFDGRYIYLFAQYEPDNLAARYDTTKPFADAASWQTFELTRVDPRAKSFAGVRFDGKHIYLAPFSNAVIPATGLTLRFDVTKPFDDASSWTAFSTTAIAPPTGFSAIGSDGRYLYYAPYGAWYDTGVGYASTVLRYDSSASFDARASWCAFDLTTVSPAARGYSGAVFDGQHMYFAAFDSGAPMIRYTTR